jgi:hypothetical protein
LLVEVRWQGQFRGSVGCRVRYQSQPQRAFLQAFEELPHGTPEQWMHKLSGNFRSRSQDKVAIPHGGVREYQFGGVEDVVVSDQQVEVQRSRSPANDPFAATAVFCLLKQSEHLQGFKVTFKECGGVEKFTAGGGPDWSRANQAAAGTQRQPALFKPPQRSVEQFRLFTNIAPQRCQKEHVAAFFSIPRWEDQPFSVKIPPTGLYASPEFPAKLDQGNSHGRSDQTSPSVRANCAVRVHAFCRCDLHFPPCLRLCVPNAPDWVAVSQFSRC